jgi:hypothetical protein
MLVPARKPPFRQVSPTFLKSINSSNTSELPCTMRRPVLRNSWRRPRLSSSLWRVDFVMEVSWCIVSMECRARRRVPCSILWGASNHYWCESCIASCLRFPSHSFTKCCIFLIFLSISCYYPLLLLTLENHPTARQTCPWRRVWRWSTVDDHKHSLYRLS